MIKKAQGLPINTLIIAAIGLAVLIVLFILFTTEAGDFSKSTRSCDGRGGNCVAKGECQYQITSWSCPEKGKECCFNPLK